jgi:mannose-6-phosphate isomerase-like protein (cupin superfamily)
MRRVVLSLVLILATYSAAVLIRARQSGYPTPQSASESTQSPPSPYPLILQESDGEHRVARPTSLRAGFPFTIKVDPQNGNAEDFFVMTTIEPPGHVIPFHMHHNAEEILILEEGGATVTAGDKGAVAGPHSIVFIPRETWVSVAFTGTQPVHLYGLFSRQGFERQFRAVSLPEGQPITPLSADELVRVRALGHATYWDTSNGPYPPVVEQSAPQSGSKATQGSTAPYPLILQEADGERRLRRPSALNPGQPPRKAGVPFTIKVDELNGNAQDFFVLTEIMTPGTVIQFHMHHNSEEILVLEEGGATVTVGDKRAVAGPHSIVFIPRETWISVAFTGTQPVHLYGLFSRQGFEQLLRAGSVPAGQPVTPISADERARLLGSGLGHAMYWDTSKGPYPPGVAHP